MVKRILYMFPYVLGLMLLVTLTFSVVLAQSTDYQFSGDYKSHTLLDSTLDVAFYGGNVHIRYLSGIGFYVHYGRSSNITKASSFLGNVQVIIPQIQEYEDRIRLKVSNDVLVIEKKPLRLRFEDQQGQLYARESYGAGWQMDKPVHVLEKDDRSFLYATNVDFHSGEAVFGVSKEYTWAIYYLNTHVNRIELGPPTVNHWGFSADGGELAFMFISGDKPADISKKYRLFFGTSVLPPYWALGFHRILEGDITSKQVLDYSSYLRNQTLPVDVIHLNSTIYSAGTPFTWDDIKVPNANDFSKQLLTKDIRLVYPIINTFPNQTKFDFITEGEYKGVFNTAPIPDSTSIVSLAPQFLRLDATKPSALPWWKTQLSTKLDENIAGFSLSESQEIPSSKSILDRIFSGAQSGYSVSYSVDALSTLTMKALKELQPSKRPLMLSDALEISGVMISHYTILPEIKDLQSFAASVSNTIDLGIMGYPGSMMRVGKSVKNNEFIYQSILDWSAFMPGISLVEDMPEELETVTEHPRKYDILLKQYADLRYHFGPMLYTSWWQHTQDASPIVRPSWWFGIDSHNQMSNSYYIGDHLWFMPGGSQTQKDISKDFPKGLWYHYVSKRPIADPVHIHPSTNLKTSLLNAYPNMALYVRAGSVIPTREISNGQIGNESKELSLHIFAGASATSYLYEDDGSSLQHQNNSRVHQFKTENHSRGFRIVANSVGDFASATPRFSYLIHGLSRKPDRITVNGRNIVYFYEPSTNTIIFKISAGETDIQIFFP